jgi:uncharacterized protein
MSPGERDLDILLIHMDPVLDDREYVYASIPDLLPEAICVFRETEGVTLILPRTDAERRGIPFTYPCRRITLTIHSSLEAVGLFAAVTKRLAERGIGVNAVSGYYHDHLFVRTEDAVRALEALEQLRTERRNRP